MRALRQLRMNVGILFTARRNRVDLIRALARRPQLLLGSALYEVAIGLSARVETRLKVLAELKVAALVACEYCLDIGSALARGTGLTERQLQELARYRTSDAYDDEERLVLELAEAMTRAPAVITEELRSQLDRRFSPTQLSELAAVIAWENQRARLNQALGIRPSGFSDGEFCVLPEPAAWPAEPEARARAADAVLGPDQEGVTVRVVQAKEDEDWVDVERLIRAYLAELPFEVDFQDVDRELAELPTEYGLPSGTALLVRADDGAAVGVVGVRRLDDADAELKRMYLDPTVRGGGLGRALADVAVTAARSLGYRRLLLDTVDSMAPAIAVYEGLGFMEIEPYRHNPLAGARYFALDLQAD